MRILAFSDLHRDQAAARIIVEASTRADIVVGAGDFATMGKGFADCFDFLCEINVPCVLVAGNHDNLAEMLFAAANHPFIHILHGEGVVIDGVPFFGLGYEIPARADHVWNQRLSETEADALLSSCPENAVLVTHSPPFGVADMQRNGMHEGSRAINATIKMRQPRLVLCGHIHNAWGTSGMIGDSLVHNLGPRPCWFDL